MRKQLYEKINSIIIKYLTGIYNEKDFQASLNSLIYEITEYELLDVRELLKSAESDLEIINFLVSRNEQHEEYVKVIEKIKETLLST